MGHPQPLFVYFRLFKHTLHFLQQIYVKNCPSSIWCWDLNPQHSVHESPPITTRPGLPPNVKHFCFIILLASRVCIRNFQFRETALRCLRLSLYTMFYGNFNFYCNRPISSLKSQLRIC